MTEINFDGLGALEAEIGLINYDKTAHNYQEQLKQNGMTHSKRRKEDCWDSAIVENFFHTLKNQMHP